MNNLNIIGDFSNIEIFTEQSDGLVYVANNRCQVGRLDLETNQIVDVVHTAVNFTDLALAKDGDLYGATFDELYKIDPETGATTHIGSFSNHSINGLGFDSNGNLYASSFNGGLYQVDINSGSLTHVAGTAGFKSSGDVVWDETQERFFGTDSHGNLWSLDPNGHSEVLGNTGVSDLYGLYMEDGKLFGISAEFGLYELNQTNAHAVHVDTVEGLGGHLWGSASNTQTTTQEVGIINIDEGNTPVIDLNLENQAEGHAVYEIIGGADADLFAIDSTTGELSFKDAPDFENPLDNGADNSYDVRVRVTQNGFTPDEQDIVVNVGDVNENTAPDAVNDHASTTAGQKVGIRVLNNDSDPDGDTVSLESFTQATNGRVVRNHGGTEGDRSDDRLVYIPNEGFTGEDTFTYTIGDGNGGFDTAEVKVIVDGANTAPVAVDDSVTTTEGTKVGVRVLNNDSDPDGDTLQLKSFTQAANGRVVRNNGGTKGDLSDDRLVYTPNDGFTGTDTFTYTIADGKGGFDTAEVTVTVDAANTAPVAVDDSATTTEGTKVGVRVLNNDSDPDGDTLQLKSFTQAANGRVVRNNGGTKGDLSDDRLVYTPNEGFSGTDSFTYTISDGKGGHDTATVDVVVEPAISSDVDLAINKETTQVSNSDAEPFSGSNDAAFPFDVVRYDITVSNLSDNTATGIVVKDIVPENIDLWQPGQTISGTGIGWNDQGTWGQFLGNPETVDPTNGTVTIVDPETAPEGLTIAPGKDYGLAEGHVTWELGQALQPGESVTLSYYGMREVYSGYNWQTGTQFFTEASITQIDQHDTDLSNNTDSSRSWWISPISFDLNGDGVQTISIEQGVQFDLLNTGSQVNTGWLSGEDAFLATDDNGNGIIDDRSELFGGAVGEGFAELATFDSNGDAQVNALDDRFSELLVWQDANENGLTDAGELISLESAGIASISTEYTDVFSTDAQGNILGEFSTATRTDGSALEVVDAYFQVEA